MKKKQTFLLLVLAGVLAACTPVAETALPPPSLPPGESFLLPSPDDRWKAVLSRTAGSLELVDSQGGKHTVFPEGSAATDAIWSPDSSRLVVALSNTPGKAQAPQETGIAEFWMVMVNSSGVDEPRLIRALQLSDEAAGPWIAFGAWSPDGSRLLFWAGPLSASVQADGTPLWSLEVETGRATRLAEATLLNPAYQSWAPDGSALAFTNGGYRSAQVGKWLSLYEVASGQVTTLVPQDELVPGQVAWSPAGEAIAFAAVEANQTGDEWADWMGWDNPALLARRVYLLDVQSGRYRRLNATEDYQDAPRWSADGETLHYVQMDGDQALLMAADPSSGEAQPLPSCQAPMPSRAGYYGQVAWTDLYESCPEASQSGKEKSQ